MSKLWISLEIIIKNYVIHIITDVKMCTLSDDMVSYKI